MDQVFQELLEKTWELSWLQMVHETGCMPGVEENSVMDFSDCVVINNNGIWDWYWTYKLNIPMRDDLKNHVTQRLISSGNL